MATVSTGFQSLCDSAIERLPNEKRRDWHGQSHGEWEHWDMRLAKRVPYRRHRVDTMPLWMLPKKSKSGVGPLVLLDRYE